MVLARCYANLYWMFKDLFGIEIKYLVFAQTFGVFVALAFLTAATFLYYELKRREKLGWMKPYEYEAMVGEPAKPLELLLNFVLGFIIGLKLIGLAVDSKAALENPQVWMLSSKGSIIGGLVLGTLLALQKWYEKNKEKLPEPRKETMKLYPHDMIGDIVLMAAIGGISGAKIFYLFESPGNFEAFLQDPFGSFFGGLTIFGGILLGAVTVLTYAYKRKINLLQMADATSPTLLIAVAVGRMGCQTAGDGDWGIVNTMAKPGWLSWLPDWAWAYDYAHNVGNEGGGIIKDCHEAFCAYVTPPVFPTPLYEIIMLTALFAILWGVRKRFKAPGAMFALYFIVSGVERLLIEQIRVNTRFSFWGIQATQAEIIAVAFIVLGAAGYILAIKMYRKRLKDGTLPEELK